MENIKDRWIRILRQKAQDYEHVARSIGENPSSPDIDDICNEIEAFFAGLEILNKEKK
jgi:hypothetical protein